LLVISGFVIPSASDGDFYNQHAAGNLLYHRLAHVSSKPKPEKWKCQRLLLS
jgi:hypothetical protein